MGRSLRKINSITESNLNVCSVLKSKNESIPKQLEWSEYYNEVEGLHVEGKGNQTQKGENCHREVKSRHPNTTG